MARTFDIRIMFWWWQRQRGSRSVQDGWIVVQEILWITVQIYAVLKRRSNSLKYISINRQETYIIKQTIAQDLTSLETRCSAISLGCNHDARTSLRRLPASRSHNGGHSHCSCTVCSRRGYRGHDVFSCAFPTHSPSTRCREEHVKNVRQPWFIVIAAPRTVGTQTVSSVFVAGESFLESERSHFCPREGGSWEVCEKSGWLGGERLGDQRARRLTDTNIKYHIAMYCTLSFQPFDPK
jgi:hypothetical protein